MLDEAYQEARRRIFEAGAVSAPSLDLWSRVRGFPGLEKLDQIPSEVEQLAEHLIEINLRGTDIASLAPLKRLENLKRLKIEATKITDLSVVADFTELEVIWMSGNAISDLEPLRKLQKVRVISGSSLEVSTLQPLAKLSSLESLVISNNRISDLTPISNLSRLGVVWLDDTDVEIIAPLQKLTNLYSLRLDRTRVKDLTSIAQLEKLRHISFCGTPVENVEPLAGLRQLTSIEMYGSSVVSLAPLAEMTWVSAAAQRRSRLSSSRDGIFYGATPVARAQPFDQFVGLGQPASTVETIHYLRKLRSLPLRMPVGYKKPQNFERPKV